MKRAILYALIVFVATAELCAQGTFPENGVRDERPECYALVGGKVVVEPGDVRDSATVVIRKGVIVELGRNAVIPDDAVVIDIRGYYVYPSFIELDSDYGMPEIRAEGKRPEAQPQMLSNKPGAYAWNEALKTEFDAARAFVPDEKRAEELRAAGFGAVLTHRHDGISRGSGALVSTAGKRAHEALILPAASHHLSFRKGSSTQNYPSSLMGIIALLRQSYLDADWYAEGGAAEVNFSLEAWNRLRGLPQFFEVDNWQDVLRAQGIAEEFGHSYIMRGGGDEYRRAGELAERVDRLIVPLDFPEPYKIEDPDEAELISLAELMHWEQAPRNAAVLREAGVELALTAAGLQLKKEWPGAVHRAIAGGLSADEALRALTATPAEWLGVGDRLGRVDEGYIANLQITDGPLFAEKTKLIEHWVQGEPYIFHDKKQPMPEGRYQLSLGDMAFMMELGGEGGEAYILLRDTVRRTVHLSAERGVVQMRFALSDPPAGYYRLSGAITESGWFGRGLSDQGLEIAWSALPEEMPEEEEPQVPAAAGGDDPRDGTDSLATDSTVRVAVPRPFNAYGLTEMPEAEAVFIHNATIWTNEKEGVLEGADLLFRRGKIVEYGVGLLQPDDAVFIDGTGKHVTSGIIDEHTHVAISRGVNEGTQESSAEVRIGDVINAEDVNIYRQLGGGVVAAQLLHGSANPIGGQSAIIKFRWGSLPEDMKIRDAMPFIKFALGENVKQSNWGDNNRSRFPQSRMGVEQVYDDYFTRAGVYLENKVKGRDQRVDLELEALAEILDGRRQISCHSYQQGEINMLMKVAEKHGFTVNTFTHILEGYKLADKMREHGAGGSSFSDWWGYKFEVIDAIPYNGAIMHREGVTVAFNSDDREMARRLNQEAGKAVQYGGVPEAEAWKFVTLNPAKLLHLDHRMGSLKPGKDADVVIWSDHPLTVYAVAEKTWVDGIRYFDRARDEARMEQIMIERERLTRAMSDREKKNGKGRKPAAKGSPDYHCDTIFDEAQ